jgi:hypothetical protein
VYRSVQAFERTERGPHRPARSQTARHHALSVWVFTRGIDIQSIRYNHQGAFAQGSVTEGTFNEETSPKL